MFPRIAGLLLLVTWLGACAPEIGERDFELTIDPTLHVDGRDIDDVVALAGAMGVTRIQSIEMGPMGFRRSCIAAAVRSVGVEVAPNKLEAKLLYLQRADWEECYLVPGQPRSFRGDWSTGPKSIEVIETWRIAGDTWSVDVFLGEGVSYEVAARLLRAVHDRDFVNAPLDPSSKGVLDRIDWNVGIGIRRESPTQQGGADPSSPTSELFEIVFTEDSITELYLELEVSTDGIGLRGARRGVVLRS